MDISAVPRINSIVLTGLDFSMKPERARYEVEKGFIKPFPEIKVMHQIKSLAVMVYNQEKMTPSYHSNVCDGRNALAYFICAVHRQQAPQPQTHTRQGSVTSQLSNSSRVSCSSNGGKKNCELPKLVTTSMLPLGYWDGLFYALVAEVRSLHQDLQQRFGFGCENGTAPLHNGGQDGTSNQPVTPIDLASMLETAWYSLMDHRLVATLDDAVRMRRMRESTAKVSIDGSMDLDVVSIPERPPIVYGLMDVNDLAPEIINKLLWDKHKPEIDRACTEDFEDEFMMTAYRAEVHQQQIDAGMAATTPLPSANPCMCHLTCMCRMKCDQTAEGCACQNRVHVYHVVNEQESTTAEVRRKYIKRDEGIPNQFLGAAAGDLAQVQVPPVSYPKVKALATSHRSKEAIVDRSDEQSHLSRARTNTTDSDLAYVPGPKTPYRGAKDPFPLALYGNSPQRYPIMRRPTLTTSATEPSLSGTPSSITHNTVTRKPVPTPVVPPLPIHPGFQARSYFDDRSMTPPVSSPTVYESFNQTGQVSYPAIPQNYSQGAQRPPESFATAIRHSDQDDYYSTSPTPFRPFHPTTDPAEDYLSLLPEHPSTHTHPDELFPTLTQSPTTRPSRSTTSPSSAIHLPTLQTFRKLSFPTSRNSKDTKPHPPLPDPDFITPRPALKQRYVSAGGTAKLSERAEIPGPAFTTPHSPPTTLGASAASMTKEEVEKKMSDPEWVRANFGEAAVASIRRSGTGTTPRHSGEDADLAMQMDKRDRTSSGASRREKWKRVFSRKSSGVVEEDEEMDG